MIRRPPCFTLTNPLFPSTTLFRSPRRRKPDAQGRRGCGDPPAPDRRDRDPGGGIMANLTHIGASGEAHMVDVGDKARSEEHTSELQSLMSIKYAVFCLNK